MTVEWLDGLKQATPAAIQRAIRARAKGAYYLTLIGAPDVIPHHELDNPVQGDIDDTIPTDLVYACDRAAGRGVKAFLHPVRAVAESRIFAGSGSRGRSSRRSGPPPSIGRDDWPSNSRRWRWLRRASPAR